MCVVRLLLILVLTSILKTGLAEDSNYLQETIKDLAQNIEPFNSKRTAAPLQLVTQSPIKRAYTEESVPSLHLTKAELAAIYESAIAKGESIKFSPGDGSSQKIKAVVHEIDESISKNPKKPTEKDGYYYYYYPLKSFMDELSSSSIQHEQHVKLDDYHHKPPEEVKKPFVHSHMHQHNVHIEPMKNMVDTDKKKGLEPLFMAISGFIGMTIMFILSILVLPKLDKLKPKGFKNNHNEVTSMTRIAIQAIEGRDCAERLTCEAAKAAKAFNLHNNRFIKLLRRVAPNSVGRRIDKIGKYSDKKYKCAAIQCKRKGNPPASKLKLQTIKRKPKLL